MAIEPARSLSDALAAAQDMCVCYGDPLGNAVPFDEVLRSSSSDDEQSSALLVFIGPEGGFSDAEVAALQNAGAQAMRLSNAILRVETAAVAAASVWAAWATGNRGK
jgi:16S rRNA (uracil1498-N3)-methyltransferase